VVAAVLVCFAGLPGVLLGGESSRESQPSTGSILMVVISSWRGGCRAGLLSWVAYVIAGW